MARFLGVDLGDRRTGLALGDDATGLGAPIGRIDVPASRRDELVGAVADAAREQEADAIVVGLPVNMDGTEGPRARLSRDFAAALGARSGLEVHLHDERLTSAEADWAMAGGGLTHKQKKARRDAIAAAAMLRDFLAARARGTPGDEPGT